MTCLRTSAANDSCLWMQSPKRSEKMVKHDQGIKLINIPLCRNCRKKVAGQCSSFDRSMKVECHEPDLHVLVLVEKPAVHQHDYQVESRVEVLQCYRSQSGRREGLLVGSRGQSQQPMEGWIDHGLGQWSLDQMLNRGTRAHRSHLAGQQVCLNCAEMRHQRCRQWGHDRRGGELRQTLWQSWILSVGIDWW
jgi:hypothetical protein